MPVCSSGSSPKSGAPAYFLFDQPYVVTRFGDVAAWLTTWAMGLPATPQVTADFCSVDPPTELPVATDWPQLAVPFLAILTGAYRRFGNQVRYDKWADLCRCNASSSGRYMCYTPLVNTVAKAGSGGIKVIDSLVLASDVISANVTLQVNSSSSPGVNWNWTWSNAAGANINSSANFLAGTSGSTTFTVNVDRPAGADRLQLWASTRTIPDTSGSFNVTGTIAPICTGGTDVTPPALVSEPTGYPSAPAAPVCSTNQDVCNTLQTVLNKLDYLRLSTDLIHIQAAPYNLVHSTAHAGLTHTGEITVQGIRAFSVTVTASPTWLGSAPTDPVAHFFFGRVSWGDADGWTGTRRLVNTPTLILELPPLVTSLGYWFEQGVTATITELVAQV